jgi:hypothetical protein
MSRILLLSLALGAAFGFAPALFAQAAPASAATLGQPVANASPGPIKSGDRNCLHSTGSLIPARRGACLPVTGHSYSREEILRTGAPDTAGALRQLDPSIQVHGH